MAVTWLSKVQSQKKMKSKYYEDVTNTTNTCLGNKIQIQEFKTKVWHLRDALLAEVLEYWWGRYSTDKSEVSRDFMETCGYSGLIRIACCILKLTLQIITVAVLQNAIFAKTVFKAWVQLSHADEEIRKHRGEVCEAHAKTSAALTAEDLIAPLSTRSHVFNEREPWRSVAACHLPYGRQERAACLMCKTSWRVAQGNRGGSVENSTVKNFLSFSGLPPQGSAVSEVTAQNGLERKHTFRDRGKIKTWKTPAAQEITEVAAKTGVCNRGVWNGT